MTSSTISLKLIYVKEIKTTSPFDFDSTFHKPDHFTSGDNFFEPGTRWQTINWHGEKLGIKFQNLGSVENPKVKISVFSSKEDLGDDFYDSLIKELRYRYNLNLGLHDFYKSVEKFPIIKSAIKNLKGMRPGHPSSLYEYLIIGVVLQNATVKRSVQMFGNLLKKYGTEVVFDGKKLHCFWSPGDLRDVSNEELRELKVGYRAKSILKIDEHFREERINEFELRKKTANEQKNELLAIYGVGPATVWYLLFDVFHNWDFFEHISPWEQKIYSKLFFEREPTDPTKVEDLLKFIDQFGEYRQLAVHYIWENLWWKYRNGEEQWMKKLIRD